ncbi:hypothetical protein BJY00DRAFT_294074 [Aspergillus carlsbadensis]|nr:hypothetical protein BJY00DRAFT_294074 [Aspergillus carlsbadensis]
MEWPRNTIERSMINRRGGVGDHRSAIENLKSTIDNFLQTLHACRHPMKRSTTYPANLSSHGSVVRASQLRRRSNPEARWRVRVPLNSNIKWHHSSSFLALALALSKQTRQNQKPARIRAGIRRLAGSSSTSYACAKNHSQVPGSRMFHL